jgi:hypothetical protein
MLPIGVDRADQLRKRHAALAGDLLQAVGWEQMQNCEKLVQPQSNTVSEQNGPSSKKEPAFVRWLGLRISVGLMLRR